ncbi:MAG: 5-(carboxyamino)imidazole ribonucleotide synthase [Myxococcaceae bacterium]
MAEPILPGATVGIFGGGQLGRMLAMSARSLGYHVDVLDPDASCAARFVVDRCITARFDDVTAAETLARQSQVVTIEIEKVSLASLHAASRLAPLRPSADVLKMVQDRAVQKRWLSGNGFPLGRYREADSAATLADAVQQLGGACFAKARMGGYDGGGQAQLSKPEEATTAWSALGASPCVVELGLDLEAELSVLVARSPSGQVAVYPPALNHHTQRILDWSVLPGPMDPKVVARATDIAREIATLLRVEGLLVVELFLTTRGDIFVNELAPRPHNSFHATELACQTSQFEQAIRAVCDLPLGETAAERPVALCNLLGDLWMGQKPPPFHRALELPGVKLYLYGKREARVGRKMGHLLAVGKTPDEAVSRVRQARERLLS